MCIYKCYFLHITAIYYRDKNTLRGKIYQFLQKHWLKKKTKTKNQKTFTFDILFFRKCLKPYAFKLYPAVSIKQFLNLFDMTPLLDLLGFFFFYFRAYT